MIGYMKAGPTTYVMQYQRGRLRREGVGLAFLYYAPVSSIVAVPLASRDLPFAFQETTADFQPLTLQGQLTYRIAEPRRAAALLDFTYSPVTGSYQRDDSEKLPERLVHATQNHARTVVQRLPLAEALVGSELIVAEVLAALRTDAAVLMLGVEVLGLVLTSVRPTPEIARALEAEAREALQRRADEAIYERRNAAVEQERRIKESELNTQLAVQEKERQIRERAVAAEIAVEQQRRELLETRSANERAEADTRAYALERMLEPLRQTDWRVLSVAGPLSGDARGQLALAFRQLAENAGSIDHLSITPDLLGSLLRSGTRP